MPGPELHRRRLSAQLHPHDNQALVSNAVKSALLSIRESAVTIQGVLPMKDKDILSCYKRSTCLVPWMACDQFPS